MYNNYRTIACNYISEKLHDNVSSLKLNLDTKSHNGVYNQLLNHQVILVLKPTLKIISIVHETKFRR